jgi:SAM-dependent methyltransferase
MVPSYIWFAITSIIILYFLPKNKWTFALSFSCLAALISLVFFMSSNSVWSPYNKITTIPIKMQKTPPKIFLPFEQMDHAESLQNLPANIGLNVCIGNVFYQYILDLSDKSVSARPYLKKFQNQYNYPYEIAPALDDVLIVGAGTGNDVAAALRMGAKRIDAVEIDPMLIELGRRSHPEKPYSDSKVSIHIDDARSFMKKTIKKYDLIVFGLLDSHQIFSSMSSVRLDSYVYTTECFEEVKNILKENGIVLVSFAIGTKVFVQRMYGMMKKSFN